MYMPENIQEYILKSSASVHDPISVILTCFSHPVPMFIRDFSVINCLWKGILEHGLLMTLHDI